MNKTEYKMAEQQNTSQQTGIGSGSEAKKGVVDGIGDIVNKMPIKKLFFILLITGYSIIAFSKSTSGVLREDLWNYVIFIAFSLAVYMLLHFLEEKYGENKR